MLYYCCAMTASPATNSSRALSLSDDEKLPREEILKELKFP